MNRFGGLRLVCAAVACVLLLLGEPITVAAQTATDDEARGLFSAGEAAYSEGRYEAALDYFQRAYELSGRALLLYNIGSAADRLRQDEVALEAFERYLADTDENAPHRAAVMARVEFLRSRIAGAAAAEVVPEPGADAIGTPPPSSPDDTGPGAAPWVVLGVGAGVAVVGGVLVGLGYADAASVDSAAEGTPWTSLSAAYNRAPVLEGVGFALVGVGVAVAAAGAVWGATAGSDEPAVTATAWATPNSVGVAVMGSF